MSRKGTARAWWGLFDRGIRVAGEWYDELSRKGAAIGRGAVLSAGVGVGLFASSRLGTFIPDQLAADVCMYAAGVVAGVVVGVSLRRGAVGPRSVEGTRTTP